MSLLQNVAALSMTSSIVFSTSSSISTVAPVSAFLTLILTAKRPPPQTTPQGVIWFSHTCSHPTAFHVLDSQGPEVLPSPLIHSSDHHSRMRSEEAFLSSSI